MADPAMARPLPPGSPWGHSVPPPFGQVVLTYVELALLLSLAIFALWLFATHFRARRSMSTAAAAIHLRFRVNCLAGIAVLAPAISALGALYAFARLGFRIGAAGTCSIEMVAPTVSQAFFHLLSGMLVSLVSMVAAAMIYLRNYRMIHGGSPEAGAAAPRVTDGDAVARSRSRPS